ncbi:MAG TPA: T9SS type A sorting domain-containing protein [Bacteroidales bacterium]|nr:T9SS type A sorting domain-containing protein [Bacteroidales bacterium]
MKKNPFIILFLLFSFILFGGVNDIFAQRTGIIWVVPTSADAYPVDGNRTGNPGLNMLFEDYHVIDYRFVDSFYVDCYIDKFAFYQIQLDPEFIQEEYDCMQYLNHCYRALFFGVVLPYHNPLYQNGELVSTNHGMITLGFYDHYFNPTLVPSSSTRSNNIWMNQILMNYDIESYIYDPYVSPISGDTLYRNIYIYCANNDLIPLYYDLLTIDYLYENISIIPGFETVAEYIYPCGSYSSVTEEESTPFAIYPNPAQDEVYFAGVTPKSVIIYDILGKKVAAELNPDRNSIDIKNLPNGLYIIKIVSDEGEQFIEKVLKQ